MGETQTSRVEFKPEQFKQIEENLNALNLSDDCVISNYGLFHRLVDAAKKVKQISVFESYKTPKYGTILPFRYQETAVETMLKDFEGRGVFGDQVGLGKTIEALLTAHIMFLQKEIKNCLVICPPQLFSQWIEETENKFRDLRDGKCVFDVRVKKDENGHYIMNSSVRAVKEMMRNDMNGSIGSSPDKLPVYFLSTSSLVSNDNINSEQELNDAIADIERQIEDKRKEITQRTNDKYKLMNPESEKDRGELEKAKALARWQNKTLEETFPLLKLAEEGINEAEQDLKELEESLENAKTGSLWNNVVDLLIVDEVDTVIADALSKRGAGNKKAEESSRKKLDAIMNIKKKYCVLMSATPLRAQLLDIYYLVKIVDENRFKDERAFYNYVGASSLADLVKDEERIKRLTGLINTMFTRSRMFDEHVVQSYYPREGHDLETIIKAVRGEDGAIRKLYDGSELPLSECRRRVANIKDCIVNQHKIFFRSMNMEYDETTFVKVLNEAHSDIMSRSVVMKGLCDYYRKYRDVFVHPYINWSRRTKEGKCVNVHNSDFVQNNEIFQKLTAYRDKVVIYESKLDNRLALYNEIQKRFPDRKVFIDYKPEESAARWLNDYLNSKHASLDDVDSRSEEEDDLYTNAEFALEGKTYASVKAWNAKQFSRSDPEYSDAIYLVDKTRREGTNLNCASRLIICQITEKGKLMDPLTFEQLIGRLNRVGQLDSISVDVFVDNEEQKTLYDLYADKDGLDMVGNGKPEVSFVIPIVTEIFRNKRNRKEYRDLKENADFVDIFEYCSDHDLLDDLKGEIRHLCRILMATNVQED